MPRKKGLIVMHPVHETEAAHQGEPVQISKKMNLKNLSPLTPSRPRKPEPRKTKSISRGMGRVLMDMEDSAKRETKTYHFYDPARKDGEPFVSPQPPSCTSNNTEDQLSPTQ
eukprot:1407098-Rhodomonas_salina.1